jgi:hypothetical protein
MENLLGAGGGLLDWIAQQVLSPQGTVSQFAQGAMYPDRNLQGFAKDIEYRYNKDISDLREALNRGEIPQSPEGREIMSDPLMNVLQPSVLGGIVHSPQTLKRAAEETERVAKNWREPSRTVTAYKLADVKPDRPGEVFPLFIDAKDPWPMGEWIPAKNVPTPQFSASHPGVHASQFPTAERLMTRTKGEGRFMPQNRVWTEVELPAETGVYQHYADRFRDQLYPGIPDLGYYRTARGLLNPKPEDFWMIGGGLKINRIVPDEEIKQILQSKGMESAYFDRRPNEPVYDWVRELWGMPAPQWRQK